MKDYILYKLEKEYEKISYYLYNLSKHIERLSNDNVITIQNTNFAKINEIIKKLNNVFNNNITRIYENDVNKNNSNIFDSFTHLLLANNKFKHNYKNQENINKQLYNHIYNLTNKLKLINNSAHPYKIYMTDELFTDPYSEIKSDILDLCKKVGFASLNEALYLLIDE